MPEMHQAWPTGSLSRRRAQEGQVPSRRAKRSPCAWLGRLVSPHHTRDNRAQSQRQPHPNYGPTKHLLSESNLAVGDQQLSQRSIDRTITVPRRPWRRDGSFCEPSRQYANGQFYTHPEHCADAASFNNDGSNPDSASTSATSSTAPATTVQCTIHRPHGPFILQFRHIELELWQPIRCSGVWHARSHGFWSRRHSR